MPQPTIAAIHGFALGGGCELALACDLRYASPGAKLGQPEINLGIIPGWGGTQRLARVCGLGVAKDLILTGRLVDADEALRLGLVNGIHDPAREKAREVAELLASKSPVALAAAKRATNHVLQGRPRREPAARGRGVRRAVRERRREGGPDRLRREARAEVRRALADRHRHGLLVGVASDALRPQPRRCQRARSSPALAAFSVVGRGLGRPRWRPAASASPSRASSAPASRGDRCRAWRRHRLARVARAAGTESRAAGASAASGAGASARR